MGFAMLGLFCVCLHPTSSQGSSCGKEVFEITHMVV